MPTRIIPFVNSEFYHVLNRGVAQMPIYINSRSYSRFLKTMLYYQIDGPKPRFSFFNMKTRLVNQNKKIVEIIGYCLMPNHFHFLLQQVRDGGITEFLSKLSNSYTKYFNIRNKRNGPLFQGEFKAVHIDSNEQLLHLSRYIHLNPVVSYVTKSLTTYQWSSYSEYLGLVNTNICSKSIILDQFKTQGLYKQFVLDQEDYGRQLEQIKHLFLESET